MRRVIRIAFVGCLLASAAAAQTVPAPPQPRAVNRTVYTRTTELLAEWRPLVVGQATRLTTHLTHTTGDRLRPYTEGRVTLSLTIEGARANATADGPERPGVFRLNVTPTKAGSGRLVIDVEGSEPQHFVIDEVPVHADAGAAVAKEVPEEAGLISYAKERSWEEDFATAVVVIYFPGSANIAMVPTGAIVRDADTTRVYVQRTPERFELREVKTRRTVGDRVEVISGLRAGERIVVRGAAKMPRS